MSRNSSLLRSLTRHADEVASSVSNHRFPILLRRLAERRRITSIEFRPLLVDAVLITHPCGFRVLFNSGKKSPDELHKRYVDETEDQLAEPRLRFSLAHEFAHTLFYDLADQRPVLAKAFRAGGGKTALDNLERSCDIIASHLMLPTQLFDSAILQMPAVSAPSLKALADRAGASVEVLVRRLGNNSELLRKRVFRGCVAVISKERNETTVRAVSFPRHLKIARDLQLIRSGEKWQVSDASGAEVRVMDAPGRFEIPLVVSTALGEDGRLHRFEVQIIHRYGSKVTALVVAEEMSPDNS